MSQHFTTPPAVTTDPLPLPEHMKSKPRRWFTKPVVILPVAALVLGLGLGTANRPAPVQVPGPERIVTHTEKVNVPTTPAECLKALDLYDQVVTLSGEAMGYMNDALQAAGKLDPAGITAASTKLGPVTEKTKALTDPLIAARTTCRAAG